MHCILEKVTHTNSQYIHLTNVFFPRLPLTPLPMSIETLYSFSIAVTCITTLGKNFIWPLGFKQIGLPETLILAFIGNFKEYLTVMLWGLNHKSNEFTNKLDDTNILIHLYFCHIVCYMHTVKTKEPKIKKIKDDALCHFDITSKRKFQIWSADQSGLKPDTVLTATRQSKRSLALYDL